MLQDIRIRQRDYLIKIAQILTQELELEPLLWQVIQMAVDLVGGESGFVALYNESNGWQIRTQLNLTDAELKYIETYLSGLAQANKVSESSDLISVNMLIKRMRSLNLPDIVDGIGMPLIAHEKLIGAIVVFRSYKVNFTAYEKSILKSFAAQASIAVNNAFLYTDNLEEKKRLDAIIRSVADGIIVMNISHKVILVNSALRKMLKLSEINILNCYHDDLLQFTSIEEGVPLDDAETRGWPLNPDSKHSIIGNIRLYNSEKTIPVSVTYTPVMSPDNKFILNIIALVRDISKFKEADELKNTFISTISHELKTPVAIIKGYASTLNLADANWDQEIIKESLNVIEEEADRLTVMINDLLDASRLNSGSIKLFKTEVYLPELCSGVRKHMLSQCMGNDILIDFPEQFPTVYADEDRIHQVLTNLISNALKYAPGGNILIRGVTEDGFAVISVIDEGPGLSSDDLIHVFDRFYRSKKTSNSVKGTGLGLFLCKAIIEAHGGKISVANRDERSGAVFTFRLPINRKEDVEDQVIDLSKGS